MNTEIIILSVLTFIAGVLCKLYDDLNDNNLFYGTIYEKHKDYINEFLKGSHCVLLTYVSSIHIFPMVILGFANILQLIKEPDSYSPPYEWSFTMVLILFCIFLSIYNFSIFNYRILIIIAVFVLGQYVSDLSACINMEYGYRKLVIRGGAVILSSVLILSNYYLNFCPHTQLFWIWYIIGYCLTSCIFQYLLIHKYLPIQNNNNNNNNNNTTIEISPPDT